MKRAAALLLLLVLPTFAFCKITIGGPTAPDGKEVTCYLPVDQRIKNIGSKIDGAGMCTHSSIEMAARYQGLEQMRGFRDWCAQTAKGGGYPTKIDQQIKAFCKKKGITVPDYVQYEGKDPAILDAALRSGRIACWTYCGRDPHYGANKSVAHMTCCVCFGDEACVMDNNFIEENELVWMDRKEALDRWTGNGGGWVFVWLAAPPAPVPHN